MNKISNNKKEKADIFPDYSDKPRPLLSYGFLILIFVGIFFAFIYLVNQQKISLPEIFSI